MRPRQLSNVSSSTPAAIRFWLDGEWIVTPESVGVVASIVELDPAAPPSDVVDLEAAGPSEVLVLEIAAPSPLVEELPRESSMFPAPAQPPTNHPNKVTHMIVLSMRHLL
jgi:hypothetical protein